MVRPLHVACCHRTPLPPPSFCFVAATLHSTLLPQFLLCAHQRVDAPPHITWHWGNGACRPDSRRGAAWRARAAGMCARRCPLFLAALRLQLAPVLCRCSPRRCSSACAASPASVRVARTRQSCSAPPGPRLTLQHSPDPSAGLQGPGGSGGATCRLRRRAAALQRRQRQQATPQGRHPRPQTRCCSTSCCGETFGGSWGGRWAAWWRRVRTPRLRRCGCPETTPAPSSTARQTSWTTCTRWGARGGAIRCALSFCTGCGTQGSWGVAASPP